MRQTIILTAGLLAGVTAACDIASRPFEQRETASAWATNPIDDVGINNAIIAQRALYRYHFTPGAATLNALGRRDLAVLAAHYRRHPGELSVRRGESPIGLYKARVEAVVEALAEAGVPAESITITDALPGGDGMLSELVLSIFRDREEKSDGAPSKR